VGFKRGRIMIGEGLVSMTCGKSDRWRFVAILAAVVAALVTIGPASRADDKPPTAAAVKSLLDGVREDLDAERPSAARDRFVTAIEALSALLGAEPPSPAARSLLDRARTMRDELELQGVEVDAIELPSLPRAAAKPKGEAPAKPTKSPAGGAKKGAVGKPAGAGDKSSVSNAVSFVEQVAPILVRYCGGCHVAGRRGDFQFTSYDTLMKTGMVQKGAGADSRLIEVIRTGDMPRGGGKVSPDECAILIRWINDGAVFDGTDPMVSLRNPGAAAAPAATPAGAVKLEPGDVSFAFEVAPVLVKQCGGCHDAMQPDGNLSMVSLESLLRGGANGAPIVAGEGAASLLVRKLKGREIEGQPMPLGKAPLDPEVIATIEKWIDQGGKLDLLTAQTPLTTVAAAGRARSLSHADLLTARFEATDAVWRRAIADEEPTVITRGDLRLVGNLPESRLESLADLAEKAMEEVAETLGTTGRPLVKGGVVLMVFDKPYDYSDFWVNVLGDERPKGLSGKAGVSGDVVYGALVAPAVDSAAERADAIALIAEELAAAAFLARGTPDWFAAGAGRAVAMKVGTKSALAKTWRSQAGERLQRMRRPAVVVEGIGGAADEASVGGAFLAAASGGGSRFKAILGALDAEAPFDEAFAGAFQGPPAAVFEAWLAREGKKRSGNAGR
jgi:hypothetical protein